MSTQADRIKLAVERARRSCDRLTQKQINELNKALSNAAKHVKEKLTWFDDIAPLNYGQAVRLSHFTTLKENIDNIVLELNENLASISPIHTEDAFRLGIHDGITELKTLRIQDYTNLNANTIKALSTAMFAQIDKDALDFLLRYRLELLGDVSEQLKRNIKHRIASGIISGKSTPEIARDIGKIEDIKKDPAKFRRAGKKVFKSTQDRLMLITRTETNRAHNLGRIKFYEKANIKKVQWWSTLDNRTCPECAGLHSNVFDIIGFNPPGLHPRCRCTTIAVN